MKIEVDKVRRFDAAAFTAPAAADRIQTLALVAGVVGAVACVLGLFLSPAYFFRSYLVGWMYWVGIALGSLVLFMLQHLTRGAWGVVVRRVLEAASRTLPLMALLFIPLAFGMQYLYPWARPEALQDEILQRKAAYLNETFFFVRQVIYFAVWIGLAFAMNRLSWKQDRDPSPALVQRMKAIAAPGIIAWALAVTFASVDWLMSLEPHWFSTIYGVWLMGSQALTALAFLIVFAVWLSRREPMNDVLQPSHFHDWGKLMLAFTMLWAYFSFSQFLIIWSGNLPEEIIWYLHRIQHGWAFVALAIVIFHFALPFSLLLSRDLKRNASRLILVAFLMLAVRLLDLFWQVEPGFKDHSYGMFWMYLAAPLAIGGFWVYWFLRELKRKPLLPVNDPYLVEAFAHE